MNTSIVKVNLIPFLKIEKGELFEEKVVILVESLIINLETSGLKIVDKHEIIPKMKSESTPILKNATFEIETKPANKVLLVTINKEGLLIFGAFVNNKGTRCDEIAKSEFITIDEFNTLFPNIVDNLR